MISELYNRLKNIADTEFVEIVQDSEIIFTNSGRAQKLRVKLVDGTFVDIWYFVTFLPGGAWHCTGSLAKPGNQ